MASGALARVCAYALTAVLARRIAEGLRTGSRGRRVVPIHLHFPRCRFPNSLVGDRRVRLECTGAAVAAAVCVAEAETTPVIIGTRSLYRPNQTEIPGPFATHHAPVTIAAQTR